MTELIIWNSWAKRELVPKLNKRTLGDLLLSFDNYCPACDAWPHKKMKFCDGCDGPLIRK